MFFVTSILSSYLDVTFFKIIKYKTQNVSKNASSFFTEENRRGREALSKAMMTYVAQFIHTGDPNKPGSGLPEWNPWSNEVDGPKCILFDVDGDVTNIKMTSAELTVEGVKTKLNTLPEPLRTKVKTALPPFILLPVRL